MQANRTERVGSGASTSTLLRGLPLVCLSFVVLLGAAAPVQADDGTAGPAASQPYIEKHLCPSIEVLEELTVGLTIDCNHNGLDDDVDIQNGTAADSDGNGLLDECEPVEGDVDNNGALELEDGRVLGKLVGAVRGIDDRWVGWADFDENNRINEADVGLWGEIYYEATGIRFACSNGRDDDGDGRVDFPSDPGCASPIALDEVGDAE